MRLFLRCPRSLNSKPVAVCVCLNHWNRAWYIVQASYHYKWNLQAPKQNIKKDYSGNTRRREVLHIQQTPPRNIFSLDNDPSAYEKERIVLRRLWRKRFIAKKHLILPKGKELYSITKRHFLSSNEVSERKEKKNETVFFFERNVCFFPPKKHSQNLSKSFLFTIILHRK